MCLIILIFFTACGKTKDTQEKNYSIKISVNKTEIRADNEDAVFVNVEIKDKEGKIYSADNSKIEYFVDGKKLLENKFVVALAGTYKISAKYENNESNEITVTAKDYLDKLVITSDKAFITANNLEISAFTVKRYDQAGREMKNVGVKIYQNGVEITGMTFKTIITGSYKFIAKSGDITSNEITVTANEPKKITKIELTADKRAIAADNTDIATFKVKGYDQDNMEVNDISVTLYQDGVEKSVMTFKTEMAGTYKFTAKSENVLSNEVVISAKEITGLYKGTHLLISNESIIDSVLEDTGLLNVSKKEISNLSDAESKTKGKKIRVNPYLPFEIQKKYEKIMKRSTVLKVGDTKLFWTYNFITNGDEQITAKLQYAGEYCEVWAKDTEIITQNVSEKIGTEFDKKIYPLIVNGFYQPSDIDGNNKIAILCYDIRDDYESSGIYTGGYFWGGDLTGDDGSNDMEIFYVDTYPAMYDESNVFHQEYAYETIVHEFQHMVNFNKVFFVDGKDPMEREPVWLNEGLSQAAEQIYTGNVLEDRIDCYNKDYYGMIKNGYSILKWNGNLEDYSLSYLFLQYVKVQANKGNAVFKEILSDENHNYKSIENVAKKYIDSNMTFGNLMTSFRAALFNLDTAGLYGFKGEEGFDNIKTPIYYGSEKQLQGGGAVVVPIVGSMDEPINHGENIKFMSLTK